MLPEVFAGFRCPSGHGRLDGASGQEEEEEGEGKTSCPKLDGRPACPATHKTHTS